MSVRRPLLGFLLVFLSPLVLGGRPANANRVSDALEFHLVESVGYPWVAVDLDNTYPSPPIVVCTYVLASPGDPPATTRIRNVTPTSFELRIQQFEDNSSVTPNDVHCIVAAEGAHTLPDGRAFEAYTVVSDQVSGQAVGWQVFRQENVSATLTQSYSSPIALGQVMSFNDNRASTFFATDCDNRQNEPFQTGQADGICVGKQIGQINAGRASETLGYIVAESGTGTVNGVNYAIGETADVYRGPGNPGPVSAAVPGDFDVGAAVIAGMDGGQGGWFALGGADPLPAGSMAGFADEETVAGDTGRGHTTERAHYWLFDETNFPELTLTKTAPTSSFDEAGEMVTYSFEVENSGNTTIDAISLEDDLIGPVTCPASTLAIGVSMTCSADYTITPADVSAGSVTNIASVDGVPAGGRLDAAADTWTLTYTNGPADLQVTKTIDVWVPDSYALPGEDVAYTLTVTNEGAASPDADTLFLVDALPAEVDFWGGDFDPGVPGTGPVVFDESGTGLSLGGGSVGYATSTTRPASMADCTYAPLTGYDPSVRFICLNPQGTMPGANPDPWFTVQFRVRLK